MPLSAFGLLAAGALLLALASCNGLMPNRLSMENYNRVEKDMPYDQVVKILGDPADSKSIGVGPLSATAATWENDRAKIEIKFINQKVQLKNYVSKEAKQGGAG